MTKEQFAGSHNLNPLDVSKDTLNPALNANLVRNRLQIIEAFKYRHGAEYTYWVNTTMRRVYNQVWKYKFNYLLKGFIAFMAIREYQNYSYVNSMTVLTQGQRIQMRAPGVIYAGAFFGTCLII